jgi:hypothetical protein
VCRRCRRWRRPAAWVDGEPVCAGCSGTPTIEYCQGCGASGRGFRVKRCPRCELGYLLCQLRDDADERALARLEPLLGTLERHAKPRSVVEWLRRSPAAPILRGMLRGELAISHETLDQHEVGQAISYLRSWLVSDGILEAREERLARFERWAQAALEPIGEHPDHATSPHTRAGSCNPTLRAGSAVGWRPPAPTATSTPDSASPAG